MKKLLIVLILFFSYTTYSQTAEEYYNSAHYKAENGDHYGAIADYNKAIELNPSYTNAYNNRGNAKHTLEDYYGAITDYNKSIEIDPNDAVAYYNRGNSKNKLKDYNGSITDFNKAIELEPDLASAYNNRGVVKYIKGIDGCPDLMMAKKLGHNVHPGAMKEICN